MLQKTFFASKGTKNLVEYPKPGRDFSTKSRKRSGERRSGADERTHAACGKKRPAAPIGRQTGRERLYAGHARPGTPACTGAGNNRGRGPEHAETRPAIAPVRVAEENPARKKPRTRKSPARKRTPHGRNPARKEPRTRESPAQTRKNPARKDVSHREKAPPERMFRTKKIPGGRDRTGDHFAQFAQGKIPHGSGKYQR